MRLYRHSNVVGAVVVGFARTMCQGSLSCRLVVAPIGGSFCGCAGQICACRVLQTEEGHCFLAQNRHKIKKKLGNPPRPMHAWP